MPELLLELGCEELPASFVRKAYTDLHEKIGQLLGEAALLGEATGTSLGTPRRLIVSFPDLKERQEDATKEMRGPGIKAAFDAEGNPTPALLGFCRGQGVDPSQVRKDDQYVWVTKTIQGRSTAELLQEILPKAIRALSFEKSMRWGSSRLRFARPIRWILASFDGLPVSFDVEGVVSGLHSRGHRFYAPDPFPAGNLQELLARLRERHVEPDPEARRKVIVDGAAAVASGTPELTEALIEENVFLTEWPTAIQGEFKSDFQSLPEPVLVTAMAKHEKMFPVRGEDGKLVNRFVFVRNSGEDDSVRQGCEWVLNARFNDAKFFFDEDKKSTLTEFLEKTGGIVFQEKLGTVRQRADRLSRLADAIAEATGADESEREYARQAGLLAKADLATGLVSELSSLQGVVGGEYARREGLPDPVCWAIWSQYDAAKNFGRDCPGARTATRLVIADQLDKLAGYLGLGLGPTGSSDPFGLRRAATILIEAAWTWSGNFPSYDALLDRALSLYREQGVDLDDRAAHEALWAVFASRYESLLPDARYDVLEAALLVERGAEAADPQSVRLRVRCMELLAQDIPFVQTATRPMNLVIAARKKDIEFGQDDPMRRLEHSALESGEGLELFQVLSDNQEPLAQAVREERVEEIVRLIRSLNDPINRFVDSTMIMVDQPEVRYARLTLLHAASLQLLTAGDFTKIVVEG
jgi:glycyl-tRNA synthetase beta chain